MAYGILNIDLLLNKNIIINSYNFKLNIIINLKFQMNSEKLVSFK
jgi:hypothetical protein